MPAASLAPLSRPISSPSAVTAPILLVHFRLISAAHNYTYGGGGGGYTSPPSPRPLSSLR